MTSQSKAWKDIQAEYLDKVETALSSVKHPHIAEILEDVQSHLDQRFMALAPDEQTRHSFQAIIEQMGPASDYTELLSQNTVASQRRALPKHMLLASLAIAIIAVALLLPMLLFPTVGYIVEFEPVDSFRPQTAPELLKAFNDDVGFRVATHHFRTEVREKTLIGYICTDTKADKGAIASFLSRSERLRLRSITAASSKDLEKHYVRAQPSVALGGIPLVVSTSPEAYDDGVSPDLHEITVTFDHAMMNLSWSWVGGGETFPEITGQPRYDTARVTCSLPVKLEPGKFYWVGVNSQRHKNFQTMLGTAAQPYVILFATKDKNGERTAIPENFTEEARAINSLHDYPGE